LLIKGRFEAKQTEYLFSDYLDKQLKHLRQSLFLLVF